MKGSIKLLLFTIFILTASVHQSAAFNSEGNTAGPIKWPATGETTTINYNFISSNHTDNQIYVTNAFEKWKYGSSLTFQTGGDISGKSVGDEDGINLIRFSTGSDDDLALLAGASSITILYSDENNHIRDADMIITPDDKADQSALHEIGHFLGLAHSGVPNSVMFPRYLDRTDEKRLLLDQDDISAINALYSSSPNNYGRITGKIFIGKTLTPVYGANVVAMWASGANARMIYGSALTKGPNQGSSSGTFEIAGLPEGYYRIYAEPIEGPINQDDWPGNYASGSYWGGIFTKNNYKRTYLSTNTYVTAKMTTPDQNITVTPGRNECHEWFMYE